MDAMPWEDLCRITCKKSILASSPWLAHRFTHTHIIDVIRVFVSDNAGFSIFIFIFVLLKFHLLFKKALIIFLA